MSSPVPDRELDNTAYWMTRALAAEAALEATKTERDEAESFANEGWMWLDEALSALDVPNVFDIKAAGEKRVAAEARTVQLEAVLRELVDAADAWFEDATVCWSEDVTREERQPLDRARSLLSQADRTGDTT